MRVVCVAGARPNYMKVKPVMDALEERGAQVVLENRVSAGPGVPVWTYCDYWGTFVSVFDIAEPHRDLTIRARATVRTGQALGEPAPAPSQRWDREPAFPAM